MMENPTQRMKPTFWARMIGSIQGKAGILRGLVLEETRMCKGLVIAPILRSNKPYITSAMVKCFHTVINPKKTSHAVAYLDLH